jgi:N-acetylneuraminic acid mutarotase
MCAGIAILGSCGGSGSGTPSPEPTPAADFSIGGTVSGLFGAKSQVTLEVNGGGATTVRANGTFTFAKKIQGGNTYQVTISTEPTEPPQNCTVSNASGMVVGDVTSVTVVCSSPSSYTVGGTVTGLASGTDGVVLENNGGDALVLNADGNFAFGTQVTASESFDVVVKVNPNHPIQNCTGTNGSGTVSATVNTVTVNCAAPPQFTVSGTIENLTGSSSGLVLQVNGGNFFMARGSGTFMFANTVDGGEPYDVAIVQQPTAPVQICSVQNGTGNATGNIANVVIDCGHKEWGWINGSTANGQQGLYGTMGVATAQNIPGSRQDSATWVDAEGNLWLFGGFGLDSIGTLDQLNDLWKFSGGEWTWMGGSNVTLGNGVYGTKGVASAANTPGARFTATYASDGKGNVWLFGGWGVGSAGSGEGYLNDLWKFSDGNWTWMAGLNTSSSPSGVYGTRGVAATTNSPGGRYQAVSWVDSSGNFWLFGGLGVDANGTEEVLNDLWEFSNGEWTWVSGSTVVNQPGVYGTPSFPSPTNVPGARSEAVGWSDSFGNMWLFGGDGYAATGSGPLDDLWEYSNGGWIWQGGSSSAFELANYGTQGVIAGSNNPGSIQLASGAVDPNGNFWMIGGSGYASNGPMGVLNNLWELSPGGWTWWTGSSLVGTSGVFGTKGFFSPSNVVGARTDTMMWVDASGNVWVFGGNGYDSTGTRGYLNDLWEFKF